MPLTFLSHQAVVLPIKIRAPQRSSGTALVLGSISPDVEYFLNGYPIGTVGHTWTGLFTFCVPVTLALYWVVTRIIAEPLAAHLPEGGEFHLRDYALVRRQPTEPRYWGIVALSALVGATSHVVLDRLSGGWSSTAATHFGSWIPYDTLPSNEAWAIAKITSWVVLGAASLLMLRSIGRRRLVRQWVADREGRQDDRGMEQPAAGHPRERANVPASFVSSRTRGWRSTGFWLWICLGGLAGAILGALHRRRGYFMHEPATWIHIWLCSVSGAFIGLVLASIAWHATRSRSVQLRGAEE
jgi:hypothetical protein